MIFRIALLSALLLAGCAGDRYCYTVCRESRCEEYGRCFLGPTGTGCLDCGSTSICGTYTATEHVCVPSPSHGF